MTDHAPTVTVPADLRVEIKDERCADGITPDGMLTYLRAHGWVTHRRGPDAELWWNKAGEAMVMLPLRTDFVDYAKRVVDFLACMGKVEQRSQLAIWADLRAASKDGG